MAGYSSRGLSACTLILGAARSGKSRFAETLVLESGLVPFYLATGEAGDEEMTARIAAHRVRRGSAWQTLEESNRIEDALATHAAPGRAILVDCLTLWLSTLLLRGENIHDRVRALAAMLPRLPGSVVLVSNEVGWGIVPDNALARRFRDEAGRLHQEIAAIAQRVYLVVAGLDMLIKGDIHENTGDNRDRFSRRGKDDPAHAHAERGAKERPSARLPDQ